MPEMFKSATKLTLIILMLALVGALFAPYVNEKVLDIFKFVITSVISFYFGQKVNSALMERTNQNDGK